MKGMKKGEKKDGGGKEQRLQKSYGQASKKGQGQQKK